MAADLVGVDVDVHDGLVGSRTGRTEVRADGEDHVGVGDQRRDPPVHPGRPHRQRVAVVDGALALARS